MRIMSTTDEFALVESADRHNEDHDTAVHIKSIEKIKLRNDQAMRCISSICHFCNSSLSYYM